MFSHLEDYVEIIEHLPQELRDRFTEIRELDLQVHSKFSMFSLRIARVDSNPLRPPLPTTRHQMRWTISTRR